MSFKASSPSLLSVRLLSMPCSKPCVFLFLSSQLVFLSIHFPTPAAQPLSNTCSNIPYRNGSTFAANLNGLLSSLPSNASVTTTGFANLTIGDAPNTVYGLAQCRGDTKGDKCLNCLNTAQQALPGACPNKTGYIWYDNCLMRYDDTQIVSSPENPQIFYRWNSGNITDPTRFRGFLNQMMTGLIPKATSVPSDASLYATDEANFTSFETLYGLAQCNNNLLRSDCRTCLGAAISQLPTCCDGKRGGRVIGGNCMVRFELYKFYNDLALAPPPSPSPRRPPALFPPTTNATTT